jgi:hypothetical protein
MDFDTKASSIILVIFQMKVIFQRNVFFFHTYVCLNKKIQFFLWNHMSQTIMMPMPWGSFF